jgi:DNA-directed RNA polymerase sigma subunit (sigma70/sigma32)
MEPSDKEVEQFIESHPSGATLEECAVLFGVTRERIRQIEAAAVEKVTTRLRRLGLRSTDDV